jgi:hypothetical protein
VDHRDADQGGAGERDTGGIVAEPGGERATGDPGETGNFETGHDRIATYSTLAGELLEGLGQILASNLRVLVCPMPESELQGVATFRSTSGGFMC